MGRHVDGWYAGGHADHGDVVASVVAPAMTVVRNPLMMPAVGRVVRVVLGTVGVERLAEWLSPPLFVVVPPQPPSKRAATTAEAERTSERNMPTEASAIRRID
jgi:hypothetical protein